jgi:hypothetical protein
MEVFQKMANFTGSYLQSLDLRYTFEKKTYPERVAVEYKCGEYLITVNVSTTTTTPIIWGRIQKDALLGPQYKLLEQLEEFKREIKTKCILDRVRDI